jgi:hypothetical protein
MFSENQISYRSRLKIVIQDTLENRYHREQGMETSSAAERLAFYHFKKMYDQDNNFLN